MTKALLVLLITFFTFHSSLANNRIYESYLNDNLNDWKPIIDAKAKNKDMTNKDKLDLINLHYGYASWCLDRDKHDETEKYANKGLDLIEDLEDENYMLADLYAYRAAFLGFKIFVALYKAPVLGPKFFKYSLKSYETDPSNVMGIIQMGNLKLFTPPAFGGSKEEALEKYQQALAEMEKHSAALENDWNYLQLLSTIVYTCKEMEDYRQANDYCLKALQVAPEFSLIKNKMHPEVKKHLSN